MEITSQFKRFRHTVQSVIAANHFLKQIYPKNNDTMWDFISSDASWLKKYSKNPWGPSSTSAIAAYREHKKKLSQFATPRLSGMLKFTKTKSSMNLDALNRQVSHIDSTVVPMGDSKSHHDSDDDEKVTYKRQFAKYCKYTTLHGYRYITESHRHATERIFWACWVFFGIIAAGYLMSKIWTKWERNPTVTTVATTNYPVAGLVFPAVTICTVNKAVNEKLVIQACRFGHTLSEMKAIISRLVDPDAKNNDHEGFEKLKVSPETALKYLQLVTPKCEDYLLICSWSNRKALCRQLFKLVLTDSGYCCSFNAHEIDSEGKNAEYDLEVQQQELEYEYLQRAVWDYADKYNLLTSTTSAWEYTDFLENGTDPTDFFSCTHTYSDSMFPGICRHIESCREDPSLCQAPDNQTTKVDSLETLGANRDEKFLKDFPLTVTGAGRSRGLYLMLDTLRCGSVPTDSFKGFRVYIHDGDDFPAVAEKGYIVGPGKETQIGITAIDTYSRTTLKKFRPETRGCLFPDEFQLKYYKKYTRSSCVVECETEFVHQECSCVTYYNPGNYTICNLEKYKNCVVKSLDLIQKTVIRESMEEEMTDDNKFSFKKQKDRVEKKSCSDYCLPACNETFYNTLVTASDFPNQPQPNQTKLLREAIGSGLVHLSDINYVRGSIAILHVYFRESSIMQYKRDELFTWEDFVSNLGGVMSLCMGFSISSVIEVIYFFTYRMHIDRQRYLEKHGGPEVTVNVDRL